MNRKKPMRKYRIIFRRLDKKFCGRREGKMPSRLIKQIPNSNIVISNMELFPSLSSLSYFRIGIGVCSSFFVFEAFALKPILLEDGGICPRYIQVAREHETFNVYHSTGSSFWISVLLFFHFLVSVSFTVGYHTRKSGFLLWIFHLSLSLRLDCVSSSCDVLTRCLLFWCQWLPCGEKNSMDSFLKGERVKERRCPDSLVLLLQVCLVYYSAGMAKTGSAWMEGMAVEAVLHTHLVFPFGVFLREWKNVCKILTLSTLFLERYGWLGLLSPFPSIRGGTLVAFLLFHLGMQLCLNLALFQPVMIASLLPAIPSFACRFIDSVLLHRLEQRSAPRKDSPKKRLYYRETRKSSLNTSLASSILLWTLFAGSVSTCCRNVVGRGAFCVPSSFPTFADVWLERLGLRQDWKMFSPGVPSHSWISVPGLVIHIEPGKESKLLGAVELWKEGLPSPREAGPLLPAREWEKMLKKRSFPSPSTYFSTSRFSKFFMYDQYEVYNSSLVDHMCSLFTAGFENGSETRLLGLQVWRIIRKDSNTRVVVKTAKACPNNERTILEHSDSLSVLLSKRPLPLIRHVIERT